MRLLMGLLLGLSLVAPALAAECPKDVNPCKVMVLSLEQHRWLAGTPQTSAGSVLDVAAKAAGSDASGVIAQLLMQARAAQDGDPPKGTDPSAAGP